MEQEFFLVDEEGFLSERGDDFLARCHEAAEDAGLSPGSFVSECTTSMVELNTTPAATLSGLKREYFAVMDLALGAGREVGVRLYPLATYPLPVTPAFRPEPSYDLQAETVGRERFAHAGRCVGTHLHLEVARGTVDGGAVISAGAPAEARDEILNLFNLAVALDPAIVALTRSSPFYEGEASELAVRTARYRGNAAFGWDGVYTHLPMVGGLRPYAASPEDLVSQHHGSYRAWISALERAGFDEKAYSEAGGTLLKAHWGPVRIGGLGTVELRGIDGNYPEVILAVAAVVGAAAHRLRRERLSVTPSDTARYLDLSGDTLLVPSFSSLNRDLLRVAATAGPKDPTLASYLDSVLDFAGPYLQDPGATEVLRPGGDYVTTEALARRGFGEEPLTEDEGLRLVMEACDELERQVGEGPRRRVSAAGHDARGGP